MGNNEGKLYAVFLVEDGDEGLCTTYNPTHEVWMPSIFTEEGDAVYFLKEISSVRGYESNRYVVREVVVNAS